MALVYNGKREQIILSKVSSCEKGKISKEVSVTFILFFRLCLFVFRFSSFLVFFIIIIPFYWVLNTEEVIDCSQFPIFP